MLLCDAQAEGGAAHVVQPPIWEWFSATTMWLLRIPFAGFSGSAHATGALIRVALFSAFGRKIQ